MLRELHKYLTRPKIGKKFLGLPTYRNSHCTYWPKADNRHLERPSIWLHTIRKPYAVLIYASNYFHYDVTYPSVSSLRGKEFAWKIINTGFFRFSLLFYVFPSLFPCLFPFRCSSPNKKVPHMYRSRPTFFCLSLCLSVCLWPSVSNGTLC